MKITLEFEDGKGCSFNNFSDAIKCFQDIERQEIENNLLLTAETLDKAEAMYNQLIKENEKRKEQQKSSCSKESGSEKSGQRQGQEVVIPYIVCPCNKQYSHPWWGVTPPPYDYHTGVPYRTYTTNTFNTTNKI